LKQFYSGPILKHRVATYENEHKFSDQKQYYYDFL